MTEIIYALEADQLLAASQDDLLRTLKEAGLDGIEAPVHPDFLGVGGTSDFAGFKAKLAANNLTAPALSIFWAPFMGTSESKLFHGMIGSLGSVGSVLQSRLVVLRIPREAKVPAGVIPSLEELRREMTGLLITTQNHCDPAGMELAVELHNGGLFGTYADAMDWLYLNVPQVGAALDTLSLAETGAEAYYSTTALGPRIRLVYLAEPLTSNRYDYSELFAGLKAMAYKGPLALRPGAGGPNDVKGLAELVAEIRRRWEETPAAAIAVTES